ncbi:MAG: hypothetical protein ACP5TY_02440 [Thermodesulforhabdaceae bacterium]
MNKERLEDFFRMIDVSGRSDVVDLPWSYLPVEVQKLLIISGLSGPMEFTGNIVSEHPQDLRWQDHLKNLTRGFAKKLRKFQDKAEELIELGFGAIWLRDAICPRYPARPGLVLFVKNIHLLPLLPKPIVAFFQSRTPRCISPYDKWFKALVYALEESSKTSLAYVSSTGTTGYDITSTWCIDNLNPVSSSGEAFLPFIKVHPGPLSLSPTSGHPKIVEVSCSVGKAFCDRKQFMKCRDMIVCGISAYHVAIGIRPGGLLAGLLLEDPRFSIRPKAFWIKSWNAITKGCESYSSVLKDKPVFLWDVPPSDKISDCKPVVNFQGSLRTFREAIDWTEYLFHYTRGSRGPWTGETQEEYIRKLIAGDPLAGHEAIDVLINIAREGILRASSGARGKPVVRGKYAVVCWTALPPKEIFLLKRWNKALIRWTVEPYGIAVLKSFLKNLGARPVCYLPDNAFELLPESEKYRFQKHNPPQVNWKREREWRIPFSIEVGRLEPDKAFWFVARHEDALKFLKFCETRLRVYVLETDTFVLKN